MHFLDICCGRNLLAAKVHTKTPTNWNSDKKLQNGIITPEYVYVELWEDNVYTNDVTAVPPLNF